VQGIGGALDHQGVQETALVIGHDKQMSSKQQKEHIDLGLRVFLYIYFFFPFLFLRGQPGNRQCGVGR